MLQKKFKITKVPFNHHVISHSSLSKLHRSSLRHFPNFPNQDPEIQFTEEKKSMTKHHGTASHRIPLRPGIPRAPY